MCLTAELLHLAWIVKPGQWTLIFVAWLPQEMEPLLGLLVIGLIVAACYPGGTEPRPPKEQPPEQPWELLKFSARRLFDQLQRLSGRAACLGLAGTITAEVLTGKVWCFATCAGGCTAMMCISCHVHCCCPRAAPLTANPFSAESRRGTKLLCMSSAHTERSLMPLAQCLQGALTLLNVETGVKALTEVEAVIAFLGLLILTEDIGSDNTDPDD